MYSGMYEKDKKGIYMKLIVVAIIAFAVGALVVGGQRTASPDADTDRIMIAPLRAYTDSAADEIYHDLTNLHFTDIGNIHDRCIMATYNIADLEVNMMDYSIEISDENARIFIVKVNETGGGYTVIEQFQDYGVITGQTGIVGDYDIAIIIFYYGLRMVTIESTFSYG